MLKLNLGCGEDVRKGYDNIDIRKLPDCIQADVCELPYEKDSVDEILASDVYEHISHRKSLDLLKHWYSLLKPGGLLILRSPCIDTIVKYLLNAKDFGEIEAGIRMIFGGQEYKENAHLTICHVKTMEHYFEQIGFVDITYSFEAQNVIFRTYKEKHNV